MGEESSSNSHASGKVREGEFFFQSNLNVRMSYLAQIALISVLNSGLLGHVFVYTVSRVLCLFYSNESLLD